MTEPSSIAHMVPPESGPDVGSGDKLLLSNVINLLIPASDPDFRVKSGFSCKNELA